MSAKLFLSYCHRDEPHRERLGVHLASLKQQGRIAEWHDRKIVPGQDWATQISDNLRSANIVILLISADFIASEYCYSLELKIALEREQRGEIVVIPIMIKPCDWKGAPFGYLQALPKDARPVTKWANRDDAWAKVAEGIRAAVENLGESPSALRTSTVFTKVESAPAANPASAPEADRNCQADAIAILPNAQPLSQSEMSTLYFGNHPRHGKVTLKIAHGLAEDSAAWVASMDYRCALDDRLFETGTTVSGQPYFIFKYLDGWCLSEVIRPDNVIRGALLDDLAMQLLRQLEKLNLASRHAVHRDVTPANMILSITGGLVAVRLIDYESGCFSDEPQLPVRAYGYSAPEQSAGQAVPSSDLYSLVSSLYFFVTGKIAAPDTVAKAEFPKGAFGELTELEELFGIFPLLQCWAAEKSKRPLSAEKFLSRPRTPQTRRVSPAVSVGQFICGSQRIELFDKYYRLLA